MTEPQRKPSHPPSEPRPSRKSFAEVSNERPLRLQLFGALFVPFVLVAALLYVWRRPRAEDMAQAQDAGDPKALLVGEAGVAPSPAPAPSGSAAPPRVKLADARVISCQDSGKKKGATETCDHLAQVEQAFAKAIEGSSSCLPDSAGAGTIEYVLDVSFVRKKNPIVLTLPRSGRSFKNAKQLSGCAQAVRAKVSQTPLEGVTHAHSRYKISILATYGN